METEQKQTTDPLEEFVGFPKIHRLSREIICTEKIDGTNACVCITDSGKMLTGSRSRWITPADDNFGFARWAESHKEELLTLGPGRHWGEYWGGSIQRGYGIKEKRFSLFNTIRWCLHGPQLIYGTKEILPPCCGLVPVLYRGPFITEACEDALDKLRCYGSVASPGFSPAEGIVVFHIAGNVCFKKTLDDNDGHKGRKNSS